jgi:hypothetical protein
MRSLCEAFVRLISAAENAWNRALSADVAIYINARTFIRAWRVVESKPMNVSESLESLDCEYVSRACTARYTFCSPIRLQVKSQIPLVADRKKYPFTKASQANLGLTQAADNLPKVLADTRELQAHHAGCRMERRRRGLV